MDKITVLGAGPVGSLLATFLAQRGFEIEVFERRPDMRQEATDGGRSINLAVSARGLHALRQVDLEEVVLQQAIPMRGRMIHALDGQLSFQPYGMNESECIHSMSRGGLNQLIMTAAEDTGRVNIQFHQRVTDVDFASRQLFLHDERTRTDHSVP